MDLRDYAAAIRRHWLFTVASIIVLAVVGLAYRGFGTPSYQATSTVFVSPGTGSSNTDLGAGVTYVQSLVSSYVGIAKSPLVLNQVISQLDLKETPASLAARITVASPPTSTLINITAEDPSPTQAAAIANATTSGLQSAVAALSPRVSSGAAPLQISLVTPASTPLNPSGPGLIAYGLLGALIGFVVAVGVSVLVELFNVRVRTVDDLRTVTHGRLLGEIPEDPAFGAGPLAVQANPTGRSAEAFRILRTNLQYMDVGDRPQVIAVSSSLVREGKTVTALNLALSIADTGHSVLLIDGDLRASRLGRILSLEERAGLSDVLLGRATVDGVLERPAELGLDVLPAGGLVSKPAELLQSQRMIDLLHEARERYSYVIVDTPALVAVSDGAIIARLTDGALIVCSARRTRKSELRAALEVLDRVRATMLGVVLLGVRGPTDLGYASRFTRRLARGNRVIASPASPASHP